MQLRFFLLSFFLSSCVHSEASNLLASRRGGKEQTFEWQRGKENVEVGAVVRL